MPESVQVKDLTDEENESMKLYKGELGAGFSRFGADGQVMPTSLRAHAASLRRMSLRPDDIWVYTFPRSGTTMTQEIVWLLLNNFDYETASNVLMDHRFDFIECSRLMKNQLNKHSSQSDSGVQCPAAPVESPRLFKTHLSPSLLPPALLSCRVVYAARDPRDVAVSFYHHNRLFAPISYTGDFRTYFHMFMSDLVPYTPYFPHVKQAWEQRHHPNMLFLFYEDMVKDMSSTIKCIAKFLGKECSDADVLRLCEHLQFDKFKNNKSVNREYLTPYQMLNPSEQPFIRKGVAGGWRAYFDADMEQQAREWMQRNLQDTDLCFPHT